MGIVTEQEGPTRSTSLANTGGVIKVVRIIRPVQGRGWVCPAK
jgi:hypothetical protein